jgi:asparagine synthase (glutamine-hydrolysing)
MCGIAGRVLFAAGSNGRDQSGLLAAMLATLHHRGPDDEGSWIDPTAGVALGNRRLAVVDVASTGHQPMIAPTGRHVLTFNGEIYNADRVRPDLERRRYPFVGRSDTEVLLAAITEWGIARALERVDGMFAFALWDRDTRDLVLARDRIGEKPLYYGVVEDEFVFASEIDAAIIGCARPPTIDRDALASYLRHGCIPAPMTIYRDFFQVPPGTVARLGLGRGMTRPTLHTYWSAATWAQRTTAEVDAFDPNVVDELDSLLRDAVALRMRADVPIGALLSGGIDSSLVVALMQAQTDAPVRTFTLGFEEAEFDESGWARRVARRLGTRHSEICMTADDAVEALPSIPTMYDEPFADPSALPTALLAAFARRDVTVALTGDGGDELFGGYEQYARSAAKWTTSQEPHRQLRSWRRHRARSKARSVSREQIFCDARSFSRDPNSIVIGATEAPTILTRPELGPAIESYEAWMMYVDLVTFLPNFILTKIDRATMAHSLESRAPLLDRRLVELALTLPAGARIGDRQGKWLLRRVLDRYIEPEYFVRPKAGFEPPLNTWLRTSLRDWVEPLLESSRIRAEGFFDPTPLRVLWQEHLAGRDRTYALWPVLVFQSWLEHRSLGSRAQPGTS